MNIMEKFAKIQKDTKDLEKMVNGEEKPINRQWAKGESGYDRCKEGYCKRCDKLELKVDDGTYLCDKCKKELRDLGA